MRRKEYLNVLFAGCLFYVSMRFILLQVVHDATQNYLFYLPFDNISWYLLYIIFPFLLSLSMGFGLRNTMALVKPGKILLPMLVVLSISGMALSKSYWGYFIKRPATFHELQNANEILSITTFTQKPEESTLIITNDALKYSNASGGFHYSYHERAIQSLLNTDKSRGNILEWKEILQSDKLKLTAGELAVIQELIRKSAIIDTPEKGYEIQGRDIKGSVIEFVTSDKSNTTYTGGERSRTPQLEYLEKYYFITMDGGQLSNDHYPVYEFLISGEEIVRKQKYYYDVAGIEGFEYAFIAPILELCLLIASFAIFGVMRLFSYYRSL